MYKRISSTLLVLLCFAMPSRAQSSFSLEEAVSYGLTNSNALKMGELDVQTAEYTIKETKAIGMPKVNGGIDYSYYFYVPAQPVEDFIGPTVYSILEAEDLATAPTGPPQTFELAFLQPHDLALRVGASSLVFDGSYLYGLKGAKVYEELARRQVDATEQNIKADITKAYLNVLIAKENEQTINNNIQTIETSLKEVSAMYEAGFMESLDVDRLQLSLNTLNTQLENVLELIKLSKNLLKFQMSYPILDDISLSQSIDELMLSFEAEKNLLIEEIDPELRAEYRLLNTTQALNEIDLKRNKAGYYPNVAAFATYQENLRRRNLFDGSEVGFLPTGVVGFNINVPIYDGGDKSAKIQKVKLNMDKVELQKQDFVRGMQLQVQNAIVAYNNAMRNLSNTEKTLNMTESIYDRTRIKFTEGVGSSVEVTQAEGQLFQAQSDYTNALYQVLEAKVDIEIALGQL